MYVQRYTPGTSPALARPVVVVVVCVCTRGTCTLYTPVKLSRNFSLYHSSSGAFLAKLYRSSLYHITPPSPPPTPPSCSIPERTLFCLFVNYFHSSNSKSFILFGCCHISKKYRFIVFHHLLPSLTFLRARGGTACWFWRTRVVTTDPTFKACITNIAHLLVIQCDPRKVLQVLWLDVLGDGLKSVWKFGALWNIRGTLWYSGIVKTSFDSTGFHCIEPWWAWPILVW